MTTHEDPADEIPEGLAIRELTSADDAAALGCLAALQETLRPFDPTLKSSDEFAAPFLAYLRREVATNHGTLLVATRQDRIVGLLSMWITESAEAAIDSTAGPYAFVSDLVVLPDARGQRIGQALMAHAEIEARARGVNRVELCVYAANTGARRFYDRLGYREHVVTLKKPL